MDRLELVDFEPHIGTTFEVTSTQEDGTFADSLLLSSVRPYELHARDRRVTDTSGKYRAVPFSMFFESKSKERLPQRIYSVTHPAFADGLELFIVCIDAGEDDEGFVYECAFS